ncbi:hypothetical protein PCASD_26452 [Puccinia coronata f. sp. avenae]|uniref:Uncharacterized protein n=1 Tax=Puccinia coronata f. sp. avenae TaxID=200324 RepID=A0A2N5TID5_9BASI|nr:hypothetical protein PCASD_26452 [Puccinia coronata f. sp. avenae]
MVKPQAECRLHPSLEAVDLGNRFASGGQKSLVPAPAPLTSRFSPPCLVQYAATGDLNKSCKSIYPFDDFYPTKLSFGAGSNNTTKTSCRGPHQSDTGILCLPSTAHFHDTATAPTECLPFN